jgi:hypothetical protein
VVSKVTHKIDLSEIEEFNELSRADKSKAKTKVGNFVKEAILSNVGRAQSPVAGEGWKASLSPEYKKFKSKVSSSTIANMDYINR